MKIYIAGSISRMNDIMFAYEEYKNKHPKATIVYAYPEPDKTLTELVEKSFNNINWCDILVIVTKPDGTLGESTSFEREYARRLDKVIAYYKGEPQRCRMCKEFSILDEYCVMHHCKVNPERKCKFFVRKEF